MLYTVHFTAFCLGGGAFFSRTRCSSCCCCIELGNNGIRLPVHVTQYNVLPAGPWRVLMYPHRRIEVVQCSPSYYTWQLSLCDNEFSDRLYPHVWCIGKCNNNTNGYGTDRHNKRFNAALKCIHRPVVFCEETKTVRRVSYSDWLQKLLYCGSPSVMY